MCAECIWQNFFHFKQTTKTVNKKQTKTGQPVEEKVEDIPRSVLQNIQSILEGLKKFSLVYTVYIVRK